jgi:antitoxin component YwqK of YwqJK toxin-antitoxin module
MWQMILLVRFMQWILMVVVLGGCSPGTQEETMDKKVEPSMVRKYRDDGTLSSINPVDDDRYVHGVRVNYYEDGKTVHSKITFAHGRKHGPALWYYKNGQVYEHTNFHYGRKQGLTKRYYESGELMEEVTYELGEELPGKKRYNKQGEVIAR